MTTTREQTIATLDNIDYIDLVNWAPSPSGDSPNGMLWRSDVATPLNYADQNEQSLLCGNEEPLEILPLARKHNLSPSQKDIARYDVFGVEYNGQEQDIRDDVSDTMSEGSSTSPSMPGTPALGHIETPVRLEFSEDMFAFSAEKGRKEWYLNKDAEEDTETTLLCADTPTPRATHFFESRA